ncbi:FUSC family protein [Glaciibacter flavus]|uniref:FUSC family protein n=1 Tax=Orlajensenia flava TaxID=2565934 RepID=A0A4V3WUH4_9MICO|nr:FUSC family protein [Glaciibacter flavus]THG35767.1 FUSC family protein [Glaciibacter flavus]
MIFRRLDAASAGRRLVDSLPAVLQITVTAIAAWSFAYFVVGHASPLLAAIVAISALGFVRDARPVRVLETVLGMTLGIALAEVLLLGFGAGVVQYAIALAATMLIARFLSPAASFAVAAAVQCSLVMLSPIPAGGPFTRTIDALIGGVFALLATALIPRDPRRAATRAGRRLIGSHERVLRELADSARTGSGEIAAGALARARSLDPVSADWKASVESGLAIVRLSPFLRRSRFDLARQATMVDSLDLCTRSLRVIARRALYVVRDGDERPAAADLFDRMALCVSLLRDSLTDVAQQPVARQSFAELARHLDPVAMLPDADFADRNLVQGVRPYLVDALVATGLPADEARALLPAA